MNRPSSWLPITIVATALACAVPASAGAPEPRFARMVVIAPKAGREAAFEQGYARHLQWHLNNADPWTWHGWSFVLGERLGKFMDGTFRHAAADFDNAVDPAGDAADNDLNVAEHADFSSHAVYWHLDTPGVDATLPDASPYLSMVTYRLRAGGEAAFETAIIRCANPLPGRHAWMKLSRGGDAPEYLLLRPVRTFGAAAVLPDYFRRTHAGSRADCRIGDMVEHTRDELLRHRSELSYFPATGPEPSS